GTLYTFDSQGKLLEIKNRQGQVLKLEYGPDGRLTTVKEPVSGKYFSFHYNAAGLLEKVADSAGRAVTFGYDAEHNLVTLTDAAGYTFTYTYDREGRVLAAFDAEGRQI
ncbi:RHS repeat domain-containing protein, partial [Ammonifex thiophilus]